jgi:hypothetical protein
MASDTSAPSRSSFALSIGVALACFLVFAGILGLAYLKNRDTTVAADLTKIDAADQWKYTEAGRAERLAELHRKELAAATSYAWVDQAAGIVRLPIERAMELIVAEQEAKH